MGDEDDVQKRRPFNVSSRRFTMPAACINTCPGPGMYTRGPPACGQYGSLGSKGFGAMCSSSKRLTARLQYTGPGPAAYFPMDLSSRHSAAACRAAEARHTPGNSAAVAAHSSSSSNSVAPPPGAYDCSVTRTGEAVAWCAKPGAGAAFKASARQPASHKVPPPQLPALQRQLLQQRQATAAPVTFCDQHSQGRQQSRAAGVTLAPGGRAGLTSAKLARRISAAVLGGRSSSAPLRRSRCVFDAAARAAAEVPAVGSYDIVSVGAISSSLQRRLAEGRCSSMFARPLVPSKGPAYSGRQQQQLQQCAAVPKPVQQQHVGSAAAEQQRACHRHDKRAQRAPAQSYRMPGVGAPFRSRSPSHPAGVVLASDAALAGAPGPAFYKPGLLPAKKSHRQASSEAAAAFLAAV